MISKSRTKARALGQHLTVDRKLVGDVLRLARIRPSDTVLEIGTGTGSLTKELSLHASTVLSYEIDPGVAKIARDNLAASQNVKLIVGNAFSNKFPFDILVSFLPYSQSYEFIKWLAAQEFRTACVVVQREFCEKLLAKPGCRHYRAVSVLSQLCFRIVPLMRVPGVAFLPRPKVLSEAIRIEPNEYNQRKEILRLYPKIQRIFGFRRRMVRSVIKHLLRRSSSEFETQETINRVADIQDNRVYDLTPAEILELSKLVQFTV